MNSSSRWNVRAALALLVCAALPWQACRSSSPVASYSPRSITIIRGGAPAERPLPADVPPVAEPPQPAPAALGNPFELRSDLLHLVCTGPATGAVGQPVEFQLVLTALQQAANVVLTAYISPDATLLRTDPLATVSGTKLTWVVDKMARGESRTFRVWVRPEAEGGLMVCATFFAQPIACLVTTIGRPAISIEKTGPATAKLGEQVTYTFVVRNTGSAPAEGVVITDLFPDGMSHVSGQRSESYNVGTLGPGEGRQGTVSFRVDQRGRMTNNVTARSSNAGTVFAQAVTTVLHQQLQILKTGPREQFIGKTAEYVISVSNPGDTVLTGVTVTDNAPANTTIVGAPGASVSGNSARWTVPQLRPGERVSLGLSLRSMVAGTTLNAVAAQSTEGLTANSSAETVWRGFAAILLEMVDDPDPLQVGEFTTYTVRVTNQGTAPDSNISLVVKFPDNIVPQQTAGVTRGFVRGATVQFEELPILNAKQVATWTIKARAAAVGDGRVRAELTTTLLKRTPVIKDEATQVF